MGKSTTAYIGLGSNLGDRQASIRRALKLLADMGQIEVSGVSDLIETPPLGYFDQPKFINGVAELKTTLGAEDLYKALVEVEKRLGRERHGRWLPRTIDLDLLLFGDEVIDLPHLAVPHPQMHLRSFVLKGMCQLNADLVHPTIKEPIRELTDRLAGLDFAFNPNVPQLVSMAGIIGVGKTTLAKSLSDRLDCKLLLEPYDTNPFMPEVYAGKKELALDSQLYFLTSRVAQLNRKTLPRGQIAVSDYVFDKEQIYARRLLNDQQLDLYQKIFKPFSDDIVSSVLVVYLQDSARNCLQRIRQRSRPYEQKIELEFLQALDSDYRQLFDKWKASPVVRLSMSEFDCTHDNDVEHLADQIRSYVICNDSKQPFV
jgi:2-amino-4-hydroxy-6-hydroxymethyldihydropteridine diphosphokinase